MSADGGGSPGERFQLKTFERGHLRGVIRQQENAPQAQLVKDLRAGRLTADETLSRYSTIVYRQTRSYEETARRLGIDRRTVKSRLTLGLL